MEVFRDGRRVTTLHPEKREYASGGQVMTEAAIRPGVSRDLFVALGEPLGSDAWAMRVHIKPFIRWVWLGAILMALGGFVTAVDRRFRIPRGATDDHEWILSRPGKREQQRDRPEDPGIGDAIPAHGGGAD